MRLSRKLLVAALVIGGSGIGVSEFLVMGLLPQIAADLVPSTYAVQPDAALAATGSLVSAYAAGVVVGIFLTPVVLRRLSDRGALIVCTAVMFVGTLLTALAPTLGVAIALRFIAALSHASFIGVGAMVVAHAMGTRSYGRGSAIVHGGLAAANLVGVPVLTALGASIDWRAILGGCALLFAMPLLALALVTVPDQPAYESHAVAPPVRTRNVMLLLTGAVVAAAGGFTVLTYVAPVTGLARGNDTWLTPAIAMFAFGVGMNLGNLLAGVWADRSAGPAFSGALAAGVLGSLLLAIPFTGGAGAIIGMLCIGALLGGQGPAGQVLYLRELQRFKRFASALPSGTGNLGSFAGAVVGAGLIANYGAAAVSWGALVLGILGIVVFCAYWLSRK